MAAYAKKSKLGFRTRLCLQVFCAVLGAPPENVVAGSRVLHTVEAALVLIWKIDTNNPSSFTWEIGVSKPEVGTNPSLNRGSAEVQTGSTQPRVWIVPGER